MNVQLQQLFKTQIFPFEVNKEMTAANVLELLRENGLWCPAKVLVLDRSPYRGVLQHY